METAYAPRVDHDDWAKSVVGSMQGLLVGATLSGAVAVEHSANCAHVKPLMVHSPFDQVEAARQLAAVETLGAKAFRTFFYPPDLVCRQSEVVARVPPHKAEPAERMRATFGAHEVLGLVVHPVPGVAAVLFAALPEPFSMSRHEHHRLRQVALHIEASLRLRLRPEVVCAVLNVDGKVAHLGKSVV